MRFYIQTKELNAGILSVIKALPVRTTMQILEGVYMEAVKDGVYLKCSDLMLQKEAFLPATVEEEGKVIVPGKLFSEIARKLPAESTEISLDQKSLEIVSGHAHSSIQCIEYEEFPEMRFNGDTFSLHLKREECRDMILQTVFATAQDDSKPVLTGVLMEVGEALTMVATDSYQFAMRTLHLDSPVESREMIVPSKSLMEIARMMDETDSDVELTFTRTHVKVELAGSTLMARLLDGDYIKYKQILPTEYKTRVLVKRTELIDSIDRAQLIAREGNNNIVLKMHNNKLVINTNSFVGKVNEELDVTIFGEDMEIAFNPKFCINILKNIPDENVYMDFLTPISPAVVRPVQGDRFYYLIVPVRIYSQF